MAFFIIAIVVLVIGLILDMKNKTDFENQNGYRLVLLQKDSGNWYYEIHHASVLKIRQEYIPGVPGNIDFGSRKLAEKTGRLVLAKLRSGEQPYISRDELKKNGVPN